ncbi:hypothetical protein Leryth_005766 [Lithospermum erythrorhizon]|nr:hypothetical protein Leryth_005766 [Lithospermum erythrorhizon]
MGFSHSGSLRKQGIGCKGTSKKLAKKQKSTSYCWRRNNNIASNKITEEIVRLMLVVDGFWAIFVV